MRTAICEDAFVTGRAAEEECFDAPVPPNKGVGILRLREPIRLAHRLVSLRMTALLLACLTPGVGSFSSAAQSIASPKTLTPLEQTLIATEKSLIEAKMKDDEAYFKRTVSEDFALVGVDGMLLERQQAVDDLGDADLVELTPYDMKVVMAGDAAAIVTYDAIVRQKPEEDQGPPPRYQHFSSLWVKQADGWKLKFHQATAAHWGDW
jgi:hypothetical protein